MQAVDGGADGATALDWADDFVSGGVSAGLEAKVGLLVALPLGLDPAAFDPRGNGATDLTDQLGTISPGLFNSFLTARILEARLGRNVHQDDLQSICEAQHLNGGWSYDGVADVPAPAAPAPDGVDTAGFAALALAAAGVPSADPVMAGAAGHFAAEQRATGAWPPADFGFGTPDDPNSTVMSVLGYAATGEDPLALTHDAKAFLEAQQITTAGPGLGRIMSPFDAPEPVGPNTFPTSQTIQGFALLAGSPTWLPVAGLDDRQCLPAHSFNDVPPTAWNDNALRWLAEFDLAAGFPDGSFGPLGVFNRAQASLWFDRFFPEVRRRAARLHRRAPRGSTAGRELRR